MANMLQEWQEQAANNAKLRYQPQLEGLADLLHAAQQQFNRSVVAGRNEGTLASQAAQQAVAPTTAIFDSAAKEAAGARALLGSAHLSPDSPFAIAAGNEQAAGAERLAQSRSHALSDLQARKVAAAELPAFTRQAALAQLLNEQKSIHSKEQSLRGAEGADRSAEVGKQRGEYNKQRTSERNNERTTHASETDSQRSRETQERDTRESNRVKKEIAEGKNGSGGKIKPASRDEQHKAESTVTAIKQLLGKIEGSRAEKIATLQEGVPSASKKEPNGQTVKSAAIPAYKPDVLMSAALDWSEYGHLTEHTQHRLEQAGYNVHELGVPLPPHRHGGVAGVGDRLKEALFGGY